MPDADSPSDDEPSHFRVEGSSAALELHIGLQSRGVSDSPHELDVSVLPAIFGQARRQDGGGVYEGPLTHGLELKAYDAKHKLDQSIPRALLGVAIDLELMWVLPRIAFRSHGGHEKEARLTGRCRYAVISSTALYANSVRLLEHHGAVAAGEVLPGSNEGQIDMLVDEISGLLGRP